MIPFEEWVAVDQVAARRMARDPEVKPLWLRVMFAAMGWSNAIGHTNFAHGGLAFVLQDNDPEKGDLNIPRASTVAHAIAGAKQRGLIGEASDAVCLVAPDWWTKRGGRGGTSCRHHGIRAPRRNAPLR